jgi:hypothetical protein
MPESEEVNQEVKESSGPSDDITRFFKMNQAELLEALEYYSTELDKFRIRAHSTYKKREMAYSEWKGKEAQLWHDGKTHGTNEQDRKNKAYTLCSTEINNHRDLMILEDLANTNANRLSDRIERLVLLIQLKGKA